MFQVHRSKGPAHFKCFGFHSNQSRIQEAKRANQSKKYRMPPKAIIKDMEVKLPSPTHKPTFMSCTFLLLAVLPSLARTVSSLMPWHWGSLLGQVDVHRFFPCGAPGWKLFGVHDPAAAASAWGISHLQFALELDAILYIRSLAACDQPVCW